MQAGAPREAEKPSLRLLALITLLEEKLPGLESSIDEASQQIRVAIQKQGDSYDILDGYEGRCTDNKKIGPKSKMRKVKLVWKHRNLDTVNFDRLHPYATQTIEVSSSSKLSALDIKKIAIDKFSDHLTLNHFNPAYTKIELHREMFLLRILELLLVKTVLENLQLKKLTKSTESNSTC
ncbi:hypothetical protein QAD02_018116 [Eretmocerus hayati]|uniref:Uncharacterized protein n=1 Tax=Eretmocerus hayati TaxID=131215 RepID=A0ACC2PIA9_9HYME|nr:hypothetical protein QAD02_018116 [Eretmocerus hayati]